MTAEIGIRGAAQALGVHENTIRNWARKGLLQPVRVTVMGYSRFSAADVEALGVRLVAARYQARSDPVGPLCAGWFTLASVCPHPSCWSMAAERIYLSLKRREA